MPPTLTAQQRTALLGLGSALQIAGRIGLLDIMDSRFEDAARGVLHCGRRTDRGDRGAAPQPSGGDCKSAVYCVRSNLGGGLPP
jgi:hypothetical protein